MLWVGVILAKAQKLANNEDQDQTPQNAASDQSIHC